MEFQQTEFKILNWYYDPNIISIIGELQGTGAHLEGTDLPEFQPALISGKNKRLPVAWLIIEWRFPTIGKDGNEIISYEVYDKRQFNPFNYTYDDIRATVARSFDSMLQQYALLCQEIGIQPDIPEPSLSEFESWCRHIEQFLKGKLE